MDERDFDLCDLLAHPISTGEFIASTIFLLADNQKARQTGRRTIEAQFCPETDGAIQTLGITIQWSVHHLEEVSGYNRFRDDLRRLRNSKNSADATELAALGVAFALVSVLLPEERITKVVPLGGRGDYYLNGRRDEMIEVSGTVDGNLQARFTRKKAQILLNKKLTKAIVSVTKLPPRLRGWSGFDEEVAVG